MAQTEIRNENEIWIIEPEGEWFFGYVEEQPEPVEPEPASESLEQKLARLEEQNLILMDALATVFEEVIELRLDLEGAE